MSIDEAKEIIRKLEAERDELQKEQKLLCEGYQKRIDRHIAVNEEGSARLEAVTKERDAALGRAADEARRADTAEERWRNDVVSAREVRDQVTKERDDLKSALETLTSGVEDLAKRVFVARRCLSERIAENPSREIKSGLPSPP